MPVFSILRHCGAALLISTLAACGGGQSASEAVPERTARLLGSAAPNIAQPVLPGDMSNYAISKTAAGYAITGNDGAAIPSLPSKLTRIQFADTSLALDLETAGPIYRLYQAAFNRRPDVGGLGYWLANFDNGLSLEKIAEAFIGSAEFRTLYGAAPSDLQFVTALYNNVLHRQPDQAGLAYWLSVLRQGLSRPAVLIQFAESPENVAQITPAIAAGIVYAQPGINYRPVGKLAVSQSATVGTTLTLDASGSTDANGEVIALSWSLERPAGSLSAITAATGGTAKLQPDAAGIYTVTLQLSDGKMAGLPVKAQITVSAAAVTPIADSGIYKCNAISQDLARALYALGHTYLDRDHDGKPCEANDKLLEPAVLPPTPTPSTGMCWVNGYTRKNGTYVKGYWRSC